ncbi:MAG: hypothetical protein EON98_00010 [Chitinophagaceae bacterium]|nr:MAG: hypothetical protein EON98_00010 [Chitinophagaceae bacterium]
MTLPDVNFTKKIEPTTIETKTKPPMKKKTSKENYTGVCHYCGAIFKSQKSNTKFCPGTSHRQKNGNDGPRIAPLLDDENGDIINADHLLGRIYEDRGGVNKDEWSAAYSAALLREQFAYTGPLPKGAEILVVRSYLIQRCTSNSLMKPCYKVKPIQSLVPVEKETREFIDAIDVLEGLRTKKTGTSQADNIDE